MNLGLIKYIYLQSCCCLYILTAGQKNYIFNIVRIF